MYYEEFSLIQREKSKYKILIVTDSKRKSIISYSYVVKYDMRIYLNEIKERFPHLEILNYDENIYFENINHDSRVYIPNALFVPIIGENFDGHNFISSSRCSVSLMQRDHLKRYDLKIPLIVVDNILEGLKEITEYVRGKVTVLVIGITGSTGKTTTRMMTSSILSQFSDVLTSERNINTLWGNSELLMAFSNEKYIVLEIGMDMKDEIKIQCQGLKPDIGCILNIGYVHGEKVGGIEGVFNEKRQLADYLVGNNKTVVLNTDDKRLSNLANELKANVVTIGSNNQDYTFSNIHLDENGTYFLLKYDGKTYNCNLKVLGKDYVYNAVCAIALCNQMGISIKECIKGIEEYNGFKERFEIKKINNHLTIINDAYNANPASMKMSLDTFSEIWGKKDDIKKILVLGDMKELGSVSEKEHKKIGDIVNEMNVDSIIYLGEYSRYFKGSKLCLSIEQVVEQLKKDVDEGCDTVILLKGSNSQKLYTIPSLLC